VDRRTKAVTLVIERQGRAAPVRLRPERFADGGYKCAVVETRRALLFPAAGLLALFMLQVHPARLAGATPFAGPPPSCSPIRPGASSSFSISRIRPSS